jgi:ELWxxDGT repeat protein
MRFLKFLGFTLFLLTHLFYRGRAQQQITSLGSGAAEGSIPQNFFASEDQLFFVATSKHTGGELWKTDGTAQGTVMVKDISLGIEWSSPSNFVAFKGKVYFIADDHLKGQQLWVTDGTSTGTVRISNTIGTGISQMVTDGSTLYILRKSTDYLELWKSDGTTAGTLLVKGDIKIWNAPANLTVAGGLVYFSCQPYGQNMTRVWRSDGTDVGTFPVTPLIDGDGSDPGGTSHPTQFIEFNGSLYFIARGGQFSSPQSGLMKSDGTVAGTVAVKSINSGTTLVNQGQRIQYNGKMYFTFFEVSTTRFFIVESDGTTANTTIIFDKSYAHYFSPSQIVAKNGFLYFTVGDNADGTAMVKLDLTSHTYDVLASVAGPVRKPSIYISDRFGNTSAAATGLIFLQSQSSDKTSESTLWVTGGSSATTVKLLDNQLLSPMFTFKDKVYFRRTTEVGSELWTSDGTAAGSNLLKDINTDVSGLAYTELVDNGAIAIFSGRNMETGTEPQVTDGTIEGTHLIKDLAVGPASSFTYDITVVNGMFVFAAIDQSERLQVYRSDGSENGTTAITSFTDNKAVGNILRQTDGLKCFFDVRNPDGTYALFISDGTASGTRELMNFGKNSYGVGFSVERVAAGTNKIYFSLSGYGENLWMSDGTTAGTVKVADMPEINELTVAGDRAFFVARTGSGLDEFEVFVSDGTAGSKVTRDLNGSKSSGPSGLTALNGKVVFAATEEATGREVWITDGSESGTTRLKDILPGAEGSLFGSEFIEFQDHLYFAADDGVHGAELWRTSGTAESTVLFKDIVPGPGNSLPNAFKALNDKLYFQAYTPENGYEVWRSDGSADNTSMLVDVIPGPEYSNPFGFIEINEKLVFYADTPSNGLQLWSYSMATVTAAEDNERSVSIFPNPSQGVYRIQISNDIIGHSEIEVFSVDGRSIPGATMDTDGTLDLRHIPAGVYVIKINAGDQRLVKRIVKY